jgi:hypothetical protein
VALTEGDVRRALAGFQLGEPVTLEDMGEIRTALASRFPGAVVEVFRHKILPGNPVTIVVERDVRHVLTLKPTVG